MTYIVETKIQWLHQSSLRHEFLGGFGQITIESFFFCFTQSIANVLCHFNILFNASALFVLCINRCYIQPCILDCVYYYIFRETNSLLLWRKILTQIIKICQYPYTAIMQIFKKDTNCAVSCSHQCSQRIHTMLQN